MYLRRRFAAACVAAVALLLAVGATLARPYGNEVPPSVRVGGVDIGGLTDAEAKTALEARGRELVAADMILTSGSMRFRLDLAQVRPTVDVAGALRQAHASRDATDRIAARLGLASTVDLPLRFAVDPKRLQQALAPLAKKVEIKAQNADVQVKANGDLRLVPAKGGVGIDRKAISRVIASLPGTNAAAAQPQTLELPLRRVQARGTTASAQQAIADARTLLKTPHRLMLGAARHPIPRDVLADALAFRLRDGRLQLALERPPIARLLTRIFGRAETQPRNAAFTAAGDGSKVEIVPSRVGRVVDPEKVRAALSEDPSRKDVRVEITTKAPSFDTAAATALKITDRISEFTTPYAPGEPRVTNIQAAAAILDGLILKPGETFSLNERLGPRTVERGFVEAPQIDAGRLRDAVGGGVSQVATTLFNAAWFGGLELVSHQPHSFYISRYPMGREATVSIPSPDLVFTNDWKAPLVILVEASDDQLTVRFFSRSLGRRVDEGADEPIDFTDAKEQRITNTELEPGAEEIVQRGGTRGFTISIWRKVYRGDTVVHDDRFTWKYQPEDTIIEENPVVVTTGPDTTGSTTTPTETSTPEGSTAPEDTGPVLEPDPEEPSATTTP